MIVESLSEQSAKAIHSLIDDARETEISAKSDPIYREYALGRPRPVADHARKLMLGNVSLGDIKENLIGRCLAQISSRIRFLEFDVNNKDVKDYLNTDFATKNHMSRAVVALTTRVQTDGNAAMSVSWRGGVDGRPILHHESWWDGDKGMFVAVSDTGEVFWACSEWYDNDNAKHRTVFMPDRIDRYVKEGDGWTLTQEIPWVRLDGRPIGVPIAHFPNGASSYGPYAESTVGRVIDAQDALNASLFNRQLVSALTGSQIYYATGVSDQSEMEVGSGKMWTSPQADSRFGAIPSGDMSSLTDEANDLRAIVSGEFPVPSYRIGQGDWPAGIALVRADTPMIKQAELLIDVESPGLSSLAHRVTEFKNIFGAGDLDEEAVVTTKWRDVEEIDSGTEVEINQAKVDLYSAMETLSPTLLKKLGLLTPTEIAALIRERDDIEEEVADARPRIPDANEGF